MSAKATEPSSDAGALRDLIAGMRAAYSRGLNAMEYARSVTGNAENLTTATLIAYDLQAGSYAAATRANPHENDRWCAQIAALVAPFVSAQTSILEIGCGEATTLAGVVHHLPLLPRSALGFDISWSRCAEGARWLAAQSVAASLFVADLFNIPLEDASVDVVYTSHSLEPNGGREADAIRESLRVARRAVVLIEPLYELAHADAQTRMRQHGYVRGLKATAEQLGGEVLQYRLLEHVRNPLNPSGVVLIAKAEAHPGDEKRANGDTAWRCPLTHAAMSDRGDVFIVKDAGLVYPVLRGIPMLRREHSIIASKIIAT